MALVNMKSSKQREMNSEMEHQEYPYGLTINLEDDSMRKLGITTTPKVGTEMMVTAKCVVKSVSSSQHEGNETESRLCLQITDMSIGQTDNANNDNRASMLYGEDKDKK
jgi:hypothetical protein